MMEWSGRIEKNLRKDCPVDSHGDSFHNFGCNVLIDSVGLYSFVEDLFDV